MAGGTSNNPIWKQTGEFIAFVVNETNGITLGLLTDLDTATTGQVGIASDGTTVPIGVATSGPRTSRTATDNVVANGMTVTVCTRGVCYVTASAAAITIGDLIQSAGSGYVKSLTLSAVTDVNKIVGRALSTAAGSATETIKALITIG